jgi:PleD family two-component response regulator
MVAERVRRGVESEHTPERDTPLRRQLMVSGGVASLTEGTNALKGPMEAADGAMHRAKKSGKNRTRVEGEPASLGRRLEKRRREQEDAP